MKKYCWYISIFFVVLSSCSAQNKKLQKTIEVSILADSIQEPYVYFSEVQLNSIETSTSKKLLAEIQSLSENKDILETDANQRLAHKISAYKNCLNQNTEECQYTPEKYSLLSHVRNILSIIYSYNAFSNPDEYFKYATFDLETGKRITYNDLFKDLTGLLALFNDSYTSYYREFINSFNSEDEAAIDQYNSYIEHLETRTPFNLKDLNNFELVYNKQKVITHIRFHYNGQGGIYRNLFPAGSEEFSMEVLKPFLSEGYFKVTK